MHLNSMNSTRPWAVPDCGRSWRRCPRKGEAQPCVKQGRLCNSYVKNFNTPSKNVIQLLHQWQTQMDWWTRLLKMGKGKENSSEEKQVNRGYAQLPYSLVVPKSKWNCPGSYTYREWVAGLNVVVMTPIITFLANTNYTKPHERVSGKPGRFHKSLQT